MRFKDRYEFCVAIGLIFEPPFGPKPQSGSINFQEIDLPAMQEFCNNNPEFHIMTTIYHNNELSLVNRIDKDVGELRWYEFADGSKDPDLCYGELFNHIPTRIEGAFRCI